MLGEVDIDYHEIIVHFYWLDARKLLLCLISTLTVWGVLRYCASGSPTKHTGFLFASRVLALASVFTILSYTVFGRECSYNHQFMWYSYGTVGSLREMLMNVLLYVPLGIAATELMGYCSVPVALMLSVGIEFWQYTCGTGIAQGTDVLCNTLGCVMGTLPYLITERIPRKCKHGKTCRERYVSEGFSNKAKR